MVSDLCAAKIKIPKYQKELGMDDSCHNIAINFCEDCAKSFCHHHDDRVKHKCDDSVKGCHGTLK